MYDGRRASAEFVVALLMLLLAVDVKTTVVGEDNGPERLFFILEKIEVTSV